MKNYQGQGNRPAPTPTTRPINEPTPFGHALYIAREISSRDDDKTELLSAMSALDTDGKKKLVFRLQGEVLEGKAELPALFAVSYIAKMMSVAHFTAAARKAMREGGLTLDNLKELGLSKIVVSNDNRKVYIRYTLSYETLNAAVATLRSGGNHKAAEALEYPLLQMQKRRMLQQAAREAEEKAVNAANAATDAAANVGNVGAEVANEVGTPEEAGDTDDGTLKEAVNNAETGTAPEKVAVAKITRDDEEEKPRRGGRRPKHEPSTKEAIEEGLKEVEV